METLVAGSPEFILLQLVPPSVLLRATPPVPAHSVLVVCGSIARRFTDGVRRPGLTALQIVPPSVVLYSPSPSVSASLIPRYSVLGLCGSIVKSTQQG